MSSSEPMFLVEIILKQLKSYVKCKEFIVKTQFADVFHIILNDPCNIRTIQKIKRKTRKRKMQLLLLEDDLETNPSALFPSDFDNLISNMEKYPIELTLWSKRYPEYKLASSNIPWSSDYIDFLNKIKTDNDTQTVITTSGEYNVFDEFISRRMASVKLNIKLSCLGYSNIKRSTFTHDSLESMKHKLNVNPSTVISKIPRLLSVADTGVIKTIYHGRRKTKKYSTKNYNNKKENDIAPISKPEMKMSELNVSKTVNSSLFSSVKSEISLDKKLKMDLIRPKSCSFIHKDKLNIRNYIFGDNTSPFRTQIYCVNYFTVEKDATPKQISTVSSKVRSTESSHKETSAHEETDPINFSMKYCAQECRRNAQDTGSVDLSTLNIPILPTDNISVQKCENPTCERRTFRSLPEIHDKSIYLDVSSLKKDCCVERETVQKVEKVTGGLKAKMKLEKLDCFCECECLFGVTKNTTYCKVCRGYEELGEDLGPQRRIITEKTDMKALAEIILDDMPPVPCPVYHKLMDKVKSKTSATGSDTKQKPKVKIEKKKEEPKKGKQKNEDDKFKFNYGFTGIPAKIGHRKCRPPKTSVPDDMGWLWDSEDIQGLKFRPSWKPGAAAKQIVSMLKNAKNPGEGFGKKKRKLVEKPKRPNKRPLLTVHKKDGEYTIYLETMKPYSKPRNLNQVPYEDKDPIQYKVGRTDEENNARRKMKDRMQRRLQRDQREFIQDAFRDMCEEICLKTYQQALGILPDAEKPDCSCYPAVPSADRTDLNRSCSCSEDSLALSDTDSDEWLVEVTPPIAAYDPTYKVKKPVVADGETQYNYLDFRVKLVDKYGKPVPRFFIGPSGKQECSDLGGFWSPEKKWLQINVDGYIGPDGRWAPNTFIGPDGEHVDAVKGKFQTTDGVWLVVGIDGFVDSTGKWRYYNNKGDNKLKQNTRERRKIFETKKPPETQKKIEKVTTKVNNVKKQTKLKEVNLSQKKSEATWSCLGDVSVKYLSEMGIMGHGHDRRLLLDTLKTLVAGGDNIKMPKAVVIPQTKTFKRSQRYYYRDETKCRHATPSSKGVIAVDEDGNKIYFRIKDSKNMRPTERIATLTDQGISLSSFHVPCFHSFIKNEMMKKRHLVDGSETKSERKHYHSMLA